MIMDRSFKTDYSMYILCTYVHIVLGIIQFNMYYVYDMRNSIGSMQSTFRELDSTFTQGQTHSGILLGFQVEPPSVQGIPHALVVLGQPQEVLLTSLRSHQLSIGVQQVLGLET